ncbi:aldehyde dehydrogenase [Hypoxylon trugodes]|uniref:aldehyde dehydrogenase n=1 Tax=Hypoxylon trugodes TaxID=326681 RepID=UPI00218FAFFD|nr:aldehyde dehydrogenase [Hypoxylon trugodes]KAI1387664.1 aldehyde dehydrogenase [Hypoxylon trugodes]
MSSEQPASCCVRSIPLNFDTFQNVIDGKLSPTAKTRRSINPWTLEENPDSPLSTLEDVNKAVEAAKKGGKVWAKTPWADRKKAIEAFADAITAEKESLGHWIAREAGKTFDRGQLEIDIAVINMRIFCGLTLEEEVREDTITDRVSTRYTPLGVSAAIVPWNYPVAIVCTKAAPALLTGNSIIIKPSPYTPYCALKVAEIAQRFLPPGVFQVLTGDDNLGPWLTEHPGINHISFTGPTHIGKKVAESCSKTLKRTTLELSGNDPAVICADVDPTVAIKIAAFAFENAGQICVTIKRLYVHEAVYDAVLANIVQFVESLKVTNGFVNDVPIQPLANRARFEGIKELLADIEEKKLKIATGGTKPLPGAGETTGFFVLPTVIDNPPDGSKIVAEEQFGPVLPVIKWSDEEDVIRRVNNSPCGLGASVWTRDMAQAERISSQFETGNIWTNTHMEILPYHPWAGTKDSGPGLQSGVEGLKTYCNMHTVRVKRGI